MAARVCSSAVHEKDGKRLQYFLSVESYCRYYFLKFGAHTTIAKSPGRNHTCVISLFWESKNTPSPAWKKAALFNLELWSAFQIFQFPELNNYGAEVSSFKSWPYKFLSETSIFMSREIRTRLNPEKISKDHRRNISSQTYRAWRDQRQIR